MRSFSHTVHIDASPERVWQATVDVERWPQFVPTMRSVQKTSAGPLAIGLSARVGPKRFPASTWTVREFDAPRRFTWDTRLPGMTMTARHLIERDGAGTRLTLQLDWGGWLAALLSPVAAPIFRRNLRREAEGTRDYCQRSAP